MRDFDPIANLADLRHEFGEHGGVNMSIEASTTFTVLHADMLPDLFQEHVGLMELSAEVDDIIKWVKYYREGGE